MRNNGKRVGPVKLRTVAQGKIRRQLSPRGTSSKEKQLAYADFKNADIRGISFARAHLAGANFAYAKAGVPRQWKILLLFICFICVTFVGFVAGFASFFPLFIVKTETLKGFELERFFLLGSYLFILVAFGLSILRTGISGRLGYLSLMGSVSVVATAAIGQNSTVVAIAILQAVVISGYISALLISALVVNTTFLLIEQQLLFLILLGCFFVVGAAPGILEGSGIRHGVSTTPMLDGLGTLATTLVLVPLILFVSYETFRGRPKYRVIKSLAVNICTIFGTSFRGADLTGASFAYANLKHTDLRDAQITRTKWLGAKNVELARASQTQLQSQNIRELLISGNGKGESYDYLDFQNLDLRKFDLSNSSFIGTNLSNTNLEDANLTGAKLVQTQLYRAQLNDACLTGAYIQDWGISPETQFSNVKCDFVYMRLPTASDPDACRKPDNKQEKFKPGDFETFITPIIKTLDLYQQQNVDPRQIATTYKTVDLFHHEGIDPSAAAIALKQLAELHPEANLEVVALEGRGDDKIRLQARVTDQADRSAISAEYFERYQEAADLPYGDLQALLAAMSEKDKRIESLENMVTTAVKSEKFYVETYYDLGNLNRPSIKTILILTANPQNIDQRRLDAEVREIQAGLERAKERDRFQIITKWAVRTDDLRRALLDYEPQIVQFSGYGSTAEGLILENELGQMQFVGAPALASLFKFFKGKVECVFLNACYSTEQADAISQHIPYVIGMTQSIGERATLNFAVGFYDALGAGRSVEEAFEVGCISIDLEGTLEASKPVLKKKVQA